MIDGGGFYVGWVACGCGLGDGSIIVAGRKTENTEHRKEREAVKDAIMARRLFASTVLLLFSFTSTAAFSISKSSHRVIRTSYTAYTTHLHSQPDDNENKASDAIGGDLVTALARLDKKWELAQGGNKKIGEWRVLDVSNDESTQPQIVYLLEPESGANPSCLIFFLGGAVLGQFPHISYSAFLSRLASKVNGAVLAIPYEAGLDHFDI